MSTRSNLAIKLESGKYLQAYCHYDGYPEHMLVELQGYWTNPADAFELVHAGDIRCIQGDTYEVLSDPSPADIQDEPTCDQEYLYVYEDGEWNLRE